MFKGPERSHQWHKVHMKQIRRRASRASMRVSGINRTQETSYQDLISSVTLMQRFKWKTQKLARGFFNKINPKQYARRANQSA